MLDSLLVSALLLTPSITDAATLDPVAFEAGPRFTGELLREVTTSYDLELESISAVMNGQDVPAEFLPDLEIEAGFETRFKVRDEALQAGSMLGVKRTYEVVEGSGLSYVAMNGEMTEDEEATVTCPLIGKAVLFQRENEDEELTAEPADPAAALELPEDLAFDLDLVELLPSGKVEPGDRWDRDVAPLEALRNAGGAGLWEWSQDLDADGEWPEEPEVEGSLEITFDGWLPNGEGRLARLELEGQMTSRRVRPNDLEDIPVTTGPGTESRTDIHDWTGELIWNVEQGRMHSLEAVAELTSTSILETTEESEGPPFDSTVVLKGELRIVAGVTRQ